VIITLLTDFGLSDHFVAAMKGVILGICPEAGIVDITHQIAPQNIDQAAFVLKNAYPCFPAGTIHVVVVDPGVGSERAGLIVKVGGQVFVAPDNGVLKYAYHEEQNVEAFKISNPEYGLSDISNTFHGRDIFAPVAAHLANGVPPEEIGGPVNQFVKGRVSQPVKNENIIRGEIIYFDHFGNAITNIPGGMVKSSATIVVGDETIRLQKVSKTYADVASGEPLALVGSHGNVEIAVNGERAREVFHLSLTDSVKLLLS
jgi:S-adenosylmethionine hydrolase